VAEHFDELAIDPDDADRRLIQADPYGWATYAVGCHENNDGSVTLESIHFD
jgi:hypothetical protein